MPDALNQLSREKAITDTQSTLAWHRTQAEVSVNIAENGFKACQANLQHAKSCCSLLVADDQHRQWVRNSHNTNQLVLQTAKAACHAGCEMSYLYRVRMRYKK